MEDKLYQYKEPTLLSVSLAEGFWAARTKCIRQRTIPAIINNLRTTGRLDALKWRKGDPVVPAHPFWDSDVYKMVEACCYLLLKKEDVLMRNFVDESVKVIQEAQLEDG